MSMAWLRDLMGPMPRWLGLLPVRPRAEVVFDELGEPYLVRFTILRTHRLRLYLHVLLRGDGDRATHSHPWHFVTLPLLRGYREVRRHGVNRVRPGLPLLRTRSVFHRVTGIVPGRPAVTLVLAFVSNRDETAWAFDDSGRLIPSAAYPGIGTKHHFDAADLWPLHGQPRA